MNALIARTLVLLLLAATALHAQVPRLIKFEGLVTVNGANFKGVGQFKFAIIDADGTITHWSNDGTSTAGSEPAAAVPLTVTKGLYSVLLGDATLLNMTGIPQGVVINSDVRLRVWFNDGTNGSQLLTPDQILPIDCATGAADTWQQRATGAPKWRSDHTSVWTGSEMIVWGGERWDGSWHYLNDGGRYDPAANSWTAVTTSGAPAGRSRHTAVWTGSEMIVWGGSYTSDDGSSHFFNDGGRYNPASNTWTPLSTVDAPSGRDTQTAVWTGSEMIIWGGNSYDGTSHNWNDGGRYNPAEDRWTAVTAVGAPGGRYTHTAVWTGSEMIVWGGFGTRFFNDGGRYTPSDDRWAAVTTAGAPSGRINHTAVWTGSEMIVWGGAYGDPLGGFGQTLDTGGQYSPASNSWAVVNSNGAPAGRYFHTAAWTGSEMIVWGGVPDDLSYSNTGGRYNPAGNSWSAVTTTGAPAGRAYHTAAWTGSEMIVWGGYNESIYPTDTFSYTPYTLECEAIFHIANASLSGGNLTLSFPTAAGTFYSLWRSDTLTDDTWTNTGLPGLVGTGGILSFTVPATTPASRFFRIHADP